MSIFRMVEGRKKEKKAGRLPSVRLSLLWPVPQVQSSETHAFWCAYGRPFAPLPHKYPDSLFTPIPPSMYPAKHTSQQVLAAPSLCLWKPHPCPTLSTSPVARP